MADEAGIDGAPERSELSDGLRRVITGKNIESFEADGRELDPAGVAQIIADVLEEHEELSVEQSYITVWRRMFPGLSDEVYEDRVEAMRAQSVLSDDETLVFDFDTAAVAGRAVAAAFISATGSKKSQG
jgi:hypothetical protein